MECYVANKLILNGYTVRGRGVNMRVSDLDIVYSEGFQLGIIEVRFRRDARPELFDCVLSNRKVSKILYASRLYLLKHPWLELKEIWLLFMTYDRFNKKFVDKFIPIRV